MTAPDGEPLEQIVDALYRVAADPNAWDSILDLLPETPPHDDAVGPRIERDLSRILSVAGQVGNRTGLDDTRMPVVVLDDLLRVVELSAEADKAFTAGLGEAAVGRPLRFSNRENLRALRQAEALVRARGAPTLVRLSPDGGDFLFAYLGRDRDGRLLLKFPGAGSVVDDLHLGLSLTGAEARMANQFRVCGSLQEAADAAGVSIYTARNQLGSVFAKLGISRQSDLVRILTEFSMARMSFDMKAPEHEASPERLELTAGDGRRLSYRDYGDPDGPVLLTFHEGIGSSLLPFGTGRIAWRLGLRVVSMDRPGFGRSDRDPRYSFDSVADDAAALCSALKLERVAIAGLMSGAPFALQTACRLGERVTRVFLCSARPPQGARFDAHNPLLTYRARLEANSWITETLFGILRTRISTSMVMRALRKAADRSPGDQAYIAAHPEAADLISAYVAEALEAGGKGPADDLRAFRRGGLLSLDRLSAPLSIWHGAQDRLAPVEDILNFVGDHPHDVNVFPDIGQLMILKHWEALLTAAAAAARPQAR